MRFVVAIALAGACAKSASTGPEDFSGLADTKSDSPSGWVFRGRMDPGARSTFSYSSTDRYQGILIRVEDVHEGDIAAEVTSPDGEPLVFLVQPDGTPVPTGVESEAEGGHARLEAHDLAPGKYFLVTRERSNKAATFTVAMVDPEDPPGGSGAVVDAGVGSGSDVDAGVGSGSGSGSGLVGLCRGSLSRGRWRRAGRGRCRPSRP